MIVPVFGGEPDMSYAFGYCLLLLWSFVGVGIVADTFMVAIEVITSQEKERKIQDDDGNTRILRVKLWNDTAANLTLMALGSSAPEILLSIVELILVEKPQFMHAGALGPSVVVGSAAFNLFIISAVCVMAIPEGEVRYIQGTYVYCITAFFSIFAYVWLIFVLLVF